MPIQATEQNVKDLSDLTKDHVCAECGTFLTVARLTGTNDYALVCQRFNQHNGIVRIHDEGTRNLRRLLKGETQSMDSKALATMPQAQMLARIGMAKFPQELTGPEKLLLAQVAISYGLDPLMGEVTIYQGRPYVSIDGRYRSAQETGQLCGVDSRPATKEERDAWQIPDGDFFFCADVWIMGSPKPFVGWGRVRKAETAGGKGFKPVETNPQRMAEKRAESQALRKAFHISLPSFESAGSPDDDANIIEGEIVTPKPPAAPVPSVTPVKEAETGNDAGQEEKAQPDKPKRDPATLKNLTEMVRACHDDFKLQPKDVLAELNVHSLTEISKTPAECYHQIATRGQ